MKQLLAALGKAYGEIGCVDKSNRNQQQGYNYASDVDFVTAVRPALVTNGLTITPADVHILSTDGYTTSKGTHMLRVVGKWIYRLSHVSGEELLLTAIGEGSDSGDKASYKAATGAFKYALRQAFVIATGDDAERDSPDPRAQRYTDGGRGDDL